MKKRYVVIVLGLGEHVTLHTFLTKNWIKKYNLIPIMYVFGWNEKKDNFSESLTKLVAFIHQLQSSQSSVSLIGISAGASAAINAYHALQSAHMSITGKLITIVGRHNLDTHRWYPLSRGVLPYPAFLASVKNAETILQAMTPNEKKHIYSCVASFDEIVPASAVEIHGAKNIRVPTITHFLTIGYVLTVNRQLISILQSVS